MLSAHILRYWVENSLALPQAFMADRWTHVKMLPPQDGSTTMLPGHPPPCGTLQPALAPGRPSWAPWRPKGDHRTADGGDAWAPAKPRPDNTLIRALARAHRWERMLEEGRYRSASEIAGAENIARS